MYLLGLFICTFYSLNWLIDCSAGGENAPDLNLYTDETAQVIDTDTVTRHPARACLDTGTLFLNRLHLALAAP